MLWEYLSLLVKQNGKVCGVDLANLLLKDKETEVPSSLVVSNSSASAVLEASSNVTSAGDDEGIDVNNPELTEQMQTYMHYVCMGRKKEAVDFAVKEGLWGYAMTLASKMESAVQAKVTAAFMNSIPKNHVHHTLMQHLSGKKPEVCKVCN